MKAIRFLAITVISALAFASCNKDDNGIDPGTVGDIGIVFNIGFEPQIQTLVTTDAEFTSSWENGDQIGIFAVKRAASDTKALAVSDNYIHNVKLAYDGVKWTAASELWHAPASEVLDFYAYYPYDAAATNPLNITFNVNADQTTAVNYNASDLLMAKTTNVSQDPTPVTLTFAHKFALVQVEVEQGTDKGSGPTDALALSLRGCKVGGTLNLGDGSLVATGDVQSVKMLRVESDPATATTYTYRALVPSQRVASGRSLCLMTQNGYLFNMPKLTADLELSAGAVKRYTTTLPITAIQTVKISKGSFIMGSPDGSNSTTAEPLRWDIETQHKVTLTKDFYMSKYEVTFAQYDAYCDATGATPPEDWGWGRGGRPVNAVSWDDAVAYCKWLSDQTGGTWRLPTEAEWEYAARGDYENKATEAATMPFGVDDGTKLDYTLASFDWERPYKLPDGAYDDLTQTPPRKPIPVGSYAPNNYGLYDMHGNVGEWCSDKCDGWPADYGSAPATDPTGPDAGGRRVIRGGSYDSEAQFCRSAYRNGDEPLLKGSSLGFRVVFVP